MFMKKNVVHERLEKHEKTEYKDVGRNKSTLRQQGWMFPAIGAPEKLPLLTYSHVGNTYPALNARTGSRGIPAYL